MSNGHLTVSASQEPWSFNKMPAHDKYSLSKYSDVCMRLRREKRSIMSMYVNVTDSDWDGGGRGAGFPRAWEENSAWM
jgi:hypothetical protein